MRVQDIPAGRLIHRQLCIVRRVEDSSDSVRSGFLRKEWRKFDIVHIKDRLIEKCSRGLNGRQSEGTRGE